MYKDKLKFKKINNQSGYATLISVLIVGAVGISISTFIILSGVSSGRNSLVFEESIKARALASLCAEEALQEIRDTTSYSGSGNSSTEEGDCTYTVTNDGGQNRTITAQGEVGSVVRKLEVVIDKINPEIEVVSWQEVADL